MELGVNWIGTPEYASPEALENVFNPRFNMYHIARATDDLFALGLVMLFIGSGVGSQQLVQYYAIMSTAVCTKESFPVLRRSRSLYARFMRVYYMSGFFPEHIKTSLPVGHRQVVLLGVQVGAAIAYGPVVSGGAPRVHSLSSSSEAVNET